jgi:acylphosphatase
MHRLIAHVSGKVQAVGYRSLVVIMARTLDIRGFVQNLPNGKVFIIAEGPREDLASFVKSIRIDNSRIRVEDIFIDCKDALGEFNGFYKIDSKHEIETLAAKPSQSQKEGLMPPRGKYLAASSGLEKIAFETEKVNCKLEKIVNDREELKAEIESRSDGIEIDREDADENHSKTGLEKASANRGDQLYLFPDSKGEKMDVNDNGRR